MKISTEQWEELARAAWAARSNAHIYANTSVGAAALSSDGNIFAGCNIEHRFRSHDIHAEVNAISSMVAAGRTTLSAIIVVASRKRFTPCGACMDWIFEFGGPKCAVKFKSKSGRGTIYQASELMPFYPM